MKKQLLYSNEPDVVYGSSYAFRKAYEENCKENEVDGEWSWFESEDNFFWEDAEYKIKSMDKQASNFLLVGYCGTWRGSFPGGKIEAYLYDLILKAIRNLDYVSIYINNGAIEISGIHHDGSNSYTIHGLNKRAERTIEKWEHELSEQELHEKLNKPYYWVKLTTKN